jgi:hypothetical protein
MPAVAPQATVDPLRALIAGAFTSETERPIPLLSTSFDVSVDAGLVIVATKRLFRNDEPNSIEATITFPVPVHATLFALEARVDGRILKARAQRQERARKTYEDAVERGKGAVLHEEVLRGVHMLSVGHIPPGAEVEVSTIWATTLTVVDDRAFLRIPLTVGDIYGRPPLSDSDALIHVGSIQTAELVVHCSDGSVELVGGRLDDGRAQVGLDAPIDLVVTNWMPRDLVGLAADGREVVLRVEPQLAGDEALNVALLIDHSGSMADACSGDVCGITKHQAVITGLKSVANCLGDLDAVELWEFDDSVTRIGSTQVSTREPVPGALSPRGPRERLRAMIDRLGGPAGGTEIGSALASVTSRSAARDVLLVTDGKSYALDVQALAQTGRRFVVVLVGEDSLEANVGHLAALTGGDIFVVAGTELRDGIAAALGTLRQPCELPSRVAGELAEVKVRRGNAILSAKWRPSIEPSGDTVLARAVAAVAASLALPALDADAAARLAEAEGLVTHLTSLVLVDEAAEVQDGVPAARKIALPTPRTTLALMEMGAPVFHRATVRDGFYELAANTARIELLRVASQIDWDGSPNQLRSGDLSAVDPTAARLIERAATIPEVVEVGQRLNIDPIVLIIALLARAHASANRSAARLQRAVLGGAISTELEELALILGLETGEIEKGIGRP